MASGHSPAKPFPHREKYLQIRARTLRQDDRALPSESKSRKDRHRPCGGLDLACGATSSIFAALSVPLATNGSNVRRNVAFNFKESAETSVADARCNGRGFHLQWRVPITDGGALVNVSLEKGKNSTESLILRGMRELVRDQRPITPVVGAQKNSVI